MHWIHLGLTLACVLFVIIIYYACRKKMLKPFEDEAKNPNNNIETTGVNESSNQMVSQKQVIGESIGLKYKPNMRQMGTDLIPVNDFEYGWQEEQSKGIEGKLKYQRQGNISKASSLREKGP